MAKPFDHPGLTQTGTAAGQNFGHQPLAGPGVAGLRGRHRKLGPPGAAVGADDATAAVVAGAKDAEDMDRTTFEAADRAALILAVVQPAQPRQHPVAYRQRRMAVRFRLHVDFR